MMACDRRSDEIWTTSDVQLGKSRGGGGSQYLNFGILTRSDAEHTPPSALMAEYEYYTAQRQKHMI